MAEAGTPKVLAHVHMCICTPLVQSSPAVQKKGSKKGSKNGREMKKMKKWNPKMKKNEKNEKWKIQKSFEI